MPTTAETVMTMIIRRVVSWRLGQVTLRSSATISPMERKLNARREASPPGLPPGALGLLAMRFT